MPLNEAQRSYFADLLEKRPDQRETILKALNQISGGQESYGGRLLGMAAENALSGLTMGFGPTPTREPEGIGENLLSGTAHLAGMLPSLVLTGGAVGVGLKGLGIASSALSGPAVRYGIPALRSALTLGLHTALTKQEGEDIFDLEKSATAGGHSALLGAALGPVSTALSKAGSPLGEKLTTKFGENIMRYAVRPTAEVAGGTAFGVAEGQPIEDALTQSAAMAIVGLWHADKGIPFSARKAREFSDRMAKKAASREAFTPEEVQEVARFAADEMPHLLDKHPELQKAAGNLADGVGLDVVGLADKFNSEVDALQRKTEAGLPPDAPTPKTIIVDPAEARAVVSEALTYTTAGSGGMIGGGGHSQTRGSRPDTRGLVGAPLTGAEGRLRELRQSALKDPEKMALYEEATRIFEEGRANFEAAGLKNNIDPVMREKGRAAIQEFHQNGEFPPQPKVEEGPKAAPTEERAPATAAKEPWEMTREEFGVPEEPLDVNVPKLPNLERIAKTQPDKLTDRDKQVLDDIKKAKQAHAKFLRDHKNYLPLSNEHFIAVSDAVKAGKPVPAEVLADYPNNFLYMKPTEVAAPAAPKVAAKRVADNAEFNSAVDNEVHRIGRTLEDRARWWHSDARFHYRSAARTPEKEAAFQRIEKEMQGVPASEVSAWEMGAEDARLGREKPDNSGLPPELARDYDLGYEFTKQQQAYGEKTPEARNEMDEQQADIEHFRRTGRQRRRSVALKPKRRKSVGADVIQSEETLAEQQKHTDVVDLVRTIFDKPDMEKDVVDRIASEQAGLKETVAIEDMTPAEIDRILSRLRNEAGEAAVDRNTMRPASERDIKNSFRVVWHRSVSRMMDWFKDEGDVAMKNPENRTLQLDMKVAMDTIAGARDAGGVPFSSIAPEMVAALDKLGYIETSGGVIKLSRKGNTENTVTKRVEWGKEGDVVGVGETGLNSDKTLDASTEFVINRLTNEVVWDRGRNPYTKIDLETLDFFREPETYTLGPNEVVVTKPAMTQLFHRMELRIEATDRLGAQLAFDTKMALNDLRDYHVARGEDPWEMITGAKQKVAASRKPFGWKPSERYRYTTEKKNRLPMLNDKGRFKGWRELEYGYDHISFWDVMLQRHTPDGRKIMKLGGVVGNPQTQVTVRQLIAEGKIPERWEQTVREITAVNNRVADGADMVGLKTRRVGAAEKPFYPRDLYGPLTLDPVRAEDLQYRANMERFAVETLGMTPEKARELVKSQTMQDKTKNKKYGALESARTSEPEDGYLLNPWNAYDIYYKKAAARITDSLLFGKDYGEGMSLVLDAALEGGNLESGMKMYNRIAGIERVDSAMERVSGVVKAFTAMTRMGLSFIPQATQIVNPMALVGMRNTLQGIKMTYEKNGPDVPLRAGATFTEALRQNAAATMGGTHAMYGWVPWLRAFTFMDRWNRDVSANAGVVRVVQLAEQLMRNPKDDYTRRALEEIGVNPMTVEREMRESWEQRGEKGDKRYREAKPAGELSSNTIDTAAFTVSGKTQFLSKPENLPYYWQDPTGAMVVQFKSFIYYQQHFLRELYKNSPDARTKMKRMATYIIAAGAAGELSANAISLIKGQRRPDWEEEPLDRALDGIFYAGGFGIAFEMLRGMAGGRMNALEMFAGPNITTFARLTGDTLGALSKLTDSLTGGEEPDYAQIIANPARQVLRSVPVFGTTIGRIAFPPERSEYQAVSPMKLGPAGYIKEILSGQPQDPAKRKQYEAELYKRAIRKRRSDYKLH